MKKTQFICGIAMLFALLLAGNVLAYNAAYTHINYNSSVEPTVDGQYANNDEWVASAPENFGTNGIWRDEWTMLGAVYANLLIETTDDTNDPDDYWLVCFDSTAAGTTTPPNGGPAPQTDDYKVVITGHGASATVQWYKGTGSAWTTINSPSADTFKQAQSLSSSPMIATPHYILEMQIEKQSTELGTVIMGYDWAQYVAYYDAHQGGNGLQTWPPASASADPNVPDSWGFVQYDMNANPTPNVPEGIGFFVMATLSSIALLAGVYYKSRNKKLNN